MMEMSSGAMVCPALEPRAASLSSSRFLRFLAILVSAMTSTISQAMEVVSKEAENNARRKNASSSLIQNTTFVQNGPDFLLGLAKCLGRRREVLRKERIVLNHIAIMPQELYFLCGFQE